MVVGLMFGLVAVIFSYLHNHYSHPLKASN